MCLYISDIKPKIATEDIVCYKVLNERNGKYFTPSQGWEVKLDTPSIPDEASPQIESYGFKHCLNGGAIHAYTDPHKDSWKAIIPKGTEYWIQDDFKEVASRKLIITSTKAYLDKDQAIDFSGLYTEAADVHLKDGTRHKVTDKDYDPADVIGIYAYDNQVIGLKITVTKFSENKLDNPKTSDHKAHTKGLDNTAELLKTQEAAGLKAIEAAQELGPDWYLPSMDELERAFQNLLAINLTRKALGLEIMDYSYWYWSSDIRSDETIWVVSAEGGSRYWDFWYCRDDLNDGYYVCPFLGSHE